MYICNILYKDKELKETPKYGFYFVQAENLEQAKKEALKYLLNPCNIEKFANYYESFIKPDLTVCFFKLNSKQKYTVGSKTTIKTLKNARMMLS
jgi:hypothetical protein